MNHKEIKLEDNQYKYIEYHLNVLLLDTFYIGNPESGHWTCLLTSVRVTLSFGNADCVEYAGPAVALLSSDATLDVGLSLAQLVHWVNPVELYGLSILGI